MIANPYNERNLYTSRGLCNKIHNGAKTDEEGICKAGKLYKKLIAGSVLEEVSFDIRTYDSALEELKSRNMEIPRGISNDKLKRKNPINYRSNAINLNTILRTVLCDHKILSELEDDFLALKESVSATVSALLSNEACPSYDYPLFDYLVNKYVGSNIQLNVREDN